MWNLGANMQNERAGAMKYFVITEGKIATTRKISELKMKSSEIITIIIGLLLMFAGALIESRAIFADY